MYIQLCDICRTSLEDKYVVKAGFGKFERERSFCTSCGFPVIEFLKELGFVEPSILRQLREKERSLETTLQTA